jgi:hypothetical protein
MHTLVIRDKVSVRRGNHSGEESGKTTELIIGNSGETFAVDAAVGFSALLGDETKGGGVKDTTKIATSPRMMMQGGKTGNVRKMGRTASCKLAAFLFWALL